MSDQGHEERMADFVARYPAGPPGKQGATGAAGTVPRSMVKAFIFFTLLNLVLLAIVTAGLVHYVNANSHFRCVSLEQDIAIPIPTPIAGHESRVYAARQRAIDITRAQHLGCQLPPKKDGG